ncbi:hypothetical protein C8A00DRAFT_39520 [Chaetomidium leptoderma]|uniref:Uncharacterized protein n=1 Tax=Chaetomidium leptoderma TaxID=669021 RepID=A0AAN6VVJ0_9PEZI|nr:hypothetical protein C8A00DRAFT_39520 [Chaetomidium leptoderma]
MASPSTASLPVSTSSTVPSASTVPTSVDSNQDDNPPTVRFTNVQDLFDVINCATGDFLTVTHVSPSHFTRIEREREKRRRKFRFRRYDSNSRILLITITTRLHETLHLALYYGCYSTKLVRAGMDRDWTPIGATTFRQQGHHGEDVGEGDSTGGPRPERSGCNKWPTLVIEAGHSEPLNELHNDMRWWFRTSDHDVQIVILAKFDHRQQHILLEQWEEEISYPQGAITRSRSRAATMLEPVKRQSITITRDETTNPVSYNVTRGALVLGFRRLFLRDPGPQDGDFIFCIQDLQRYAEDVWGVVPGLD